MVAWDSVPRVGGGGLDEALDAARSGDEWAITCLYRAMQPQLLHYLRHHAPDAAEDLASETWLAAAEGFARFQGNGRDFRAWLFTIGRRRVADHYRARARRPYVVPLVEGHDLPTEDCSELAIEGMTSQRAISLLVRDLPPDQAEVMLLRVVADLSVDQVAEMMGRSPGAVRAIQHRAVERLRRTWERRAITR
jgi:RNA polymerase sigma-70 factor (ECF subfamily)